MHAINMGSENILLYVMHLRGIIPYNLRRKELSLISQYLLGQLQWKVYSSLPERRRLVQRERSLMYAD